MSGDEPPSLAAQWQAIQDLKTRVAALEQSGPTRRQALKSAGLLGVLGLAGSSGYAVGDALTQDAQAATAPRSQFGSPSNRITYFADLVDTTQCRIRQGRGLLGLPNHHIHYGKNLSTEEVSRFTLADDDKLEVWRLEAALKGGGSNADVTVDVYDATTGEVLAAVSGGEKREGGDTPLGVSGGGATVLVRVSTGSSGVDLCVTGQTAIVEK